MLDYKKYLNCPPAKREDFRLINQKAIKRCVVPNSDSHNAIWDLRVTSDGTVYFPLCAEQHFTENVWLHTYDYKTNTAKCLFKLEEKVCCRENTLHASKIHTSLCEMPDGRIIMSTHTTSQSPKHPTFMPEEFYAHPWEGYEGSNVLIYDPKTGNVENRGKPVPYESIYGGVYSPRDDAFYFTGYIRGHLYRLDLKTNKVRDYGQTTEFGSFRLALGPDLNVYCNSRSGIFYRVDTATQELLDTGIRFPKNTDIIQGINHSQFDYYVNIGKKMYIAVVFNAKPSFLVYDTETNTMTMTETYIPEGANVGSVCSPHGMAVDSKGRLWYTIKKFDAILEGRGHLLCSWDIQNGGKPILYGLVGTDARINLEVAEMEIYDDIIYAPDGNYLYDECAMSAIDINVLTASNEVGPYAGDPAAYAYVENAAELYEGDFEKDVQHLLDFMAETEGNAAIHANNPFSVAAVPTVVRTWEHMPIEDSSVVSVRFDGESVKVVCFGDNRVERTVTIRDGEVVSVEETNSEPAAIDIPDELFGLDYPFVPGRQYKAVPTIAQKLWDGRYIVGTEDGFVCIVDGKNVLSLGTAIQTCGPINCFAVCNSRKEIYGVCGGDDDCGLVFRVDDKRGLRQIGRPYFNQFRKPGVVCSNVFVSLAASDDEKHLAVGAADRLGCVYIYDIDSLTEI